MDFQQNNNFPQGNNNFDDFREKLFLSYFDQLKSYNEQIENYRTELKNSLEKTRELEQKINELASKEKDTAKNIGKIDNNIRNIRDNTIEPLAVFVGLFTFASISFSSLSRDLNPNSWISIILIIAGVTVLFSSLVIYASTLSGEKKSRKQWTKVLITISVILITAGTILHISGITNGTPETNETTNTSADYVDPQQY